MDNNGRTGHSRLGIASFLLALIPGLLFAGIILLVPLVESVVSPSPEMDAPGPGLIVIALALMTALSEISALVLGIAGALQRRRKRLFAFLGIALSLVVFMFGYIQDVVLPVWM